MTHAKAVKATKQSRQIGTSASSIAIAIALNKYYPKDAGDIVKVMVAAATGGSMKRKLTRVQNALARLPKGGD
jgi:hypothetical protein